jgi:hypothetical protein
MRSMEVMMRMRMRMRIRRGVRRMAVWGGDLNVG